MVQPGMVYKRDSEGKMVCVGLSGASGAPAAAAAPAEDTAQNPKKNFKVLVKRGRGLAKKKFYWSRIHNGKVRSTGHQAFESAAKALKDEAFDRQMVQVGQPTIEQPDEN